MMVCYFIPCALLFVTFSSFSKYCQASSDVQTRLWHFEFEDLFVPDSCDEIANVGDHLLLEFEVLFQNGSTAAAIKRPQNLKHVVLDSSVSYSFFYSLLSTVLLLTLHPHLSSPHSPHGRTTSQLSED